MWEIKGKRVLVTGATNGIGKETAIGLAKAGALVVIHGRDPGKTEKVLGEIAAASGNDRIESVTADFSSLADVRRMADDLRGRFRELHVLINNAGGIFMARAKSADGCEMTFAVNFLSHFLLTNLLLDLLQKSAPGRIIHVSSMAHRFANRIVIPGLPEGGAGWRAYALSKVCVNLFSAELAARLEGTGVTSNALHPGFVNSGFGKNNARSGIVKWLAEMITSGGISPEQGARTTLYLAQSPEVEHVTGKYFSGCKAKEPTALSVDAKNRAELWALSEGLIKGYL